MAKKSKTQKAKASLARQARKAPGADDARAIQQASSNENAETTKASKVEKSQKNVKPKKQRFQFFKNVISELKRVTWPSRDDVIRWTLVVIVALTFFGILFAVLDNWVVSPIMIAVSGLGA